MRSGADRHPDAQEASVSRFAAALIARVTATLGRAGHNCVLTPAVRTTWPCAKEPRSSP
jgi:hypothetical protein